MKYLIFILLMTRLAYAETIYEVPNDKSSTGLIKVGYSEDEGITVYYPESYKSKISQRPSSSFYVSEASCNGLVRMRVEEIQNIDSLAERERQIQARLTDKDPLVSLVDYFPFSGQRFYDSIESHLKGKGVSKIHYKYPVPRPLFKGARFEFKPGSLTAKLGIADVSPYIRMADDNINSYLHLETRFLPLACDLVNRKVQINIDWEISLMPHNNEWVETLSENQIYKIYDSMKSKQSLVPSSKLIGASAKSFIQGAIAGQAYESEVAKLNQDNIGNFAKLMNMLLDRHSDSLVDLSSNDLEDVYYRMMVDQTRALEFEGVAHAR
tara:strand:- start:5012 stop:5983 length:972 start_codon:yes stop_codon:yes gene_type:complete